MVTILQLLFVKVEMQAINNASKHLLLILLTTNNMEVR